MFLSLDILFEYWIQQFTFGFRCLDSMLGYPTGEFQALQLIVHVLFGDVEKLLASCMLVHFLQI